MHPQYLPVGWQEYHALAQKLAGDILSNQIIVDEIVAIARGGLTLGHLLSDFLRIPISTITIQSYTDIQSQGKIKITAKLQTSIKDKNILLADDVADSGRTLKRAVTYLASLCPRRIITATMFYKPRSELRPDFFVQETTKWILFPYEPTEMLTLISQQLAKDGASENDAQKILCSLGYTDEQIAFVKKYYFNKMVFPKTIK
ncbi:hypothetical protein KKG44_03655 [Patescibacteria group bacterium]|nr:hypothetical protein [Patescibacteria group bacterium]